MKKVMMLVAVVIAGAMFFGSCSSSNPSTPEPTATPTEAVTMLINYGTNPAVSGDGLTRGFYIEAYPGISMTRVTLWMCGSTAGTYTVSLTATTGTYDGAVITSKTATATLGDTSTTTAIDFYFPAEVAITKDSIVAFKMQQISGPGTAYYSLDSDEVTALGSACLITQTNGTTAPLSTFRNDGIAIRVYGRLNF